LLSLGDLRAPALSVSVARDDGGGDEVVLFMQCVYAACVVAGTGIQADCSREKRPELKELDRTPVSAFADGA
jgi:hypothetical protein